ncbi:MAG: leucyl aminopeptidase, partial [Thermoanaerobaculia bacterium]|nr:leucyl aminopeptidase [Thermoanaerobaculia bacterium]
ASEEGWEGRKEQRREAAGSGEIRRLLLLGLGRREELESRRLQDWLDDLASTFRRDRVARFALLLPSHELTVGPEAVERVARQLALTGYRFHEFKEEGEDGFRSEEAGLVVRDELESQSVRKGGDVARAVATARGIADTPPNVATPSWIADRAGELAEEHGMEIEVLETAEMERLGMGGLLAVGKGSGHEPRLVKLTWRGAGNGTRSVALVGKGVTFDTGGISIKPSKNMEEMKWDKCGACAVLGTMEVVSRLKIPHRVTGYVPLAENMPDGNSYRPSDIVRCFNGKTVEILNTDAEGRMILADALAWASEDDPTELVELSTLTGACVVALGRTGAGLYTPSDELSAELLDAAKGEGERLWRMPLWSEFREEMEGEHADLQNVGGRWGGANTAAAFLSSFVGGVERWAHLDIAGPSYTTEDPKGATGYGVATLARWLRSLDL